MPQTFGNLGAHVAYHQSVLQTEAEARRQAQPDVSSAAHSTLSGRFRAVFATVQRNSRRRAGAPLRSGRALGNIGSGNLVGTPLSTIGPPS